MNASLVKFAASLALVMASTAAFAHAQLEKATPPVGGTVASASEIRLEFSERVEPRFSGMTLTAPRGASVPLGPARAQGGDGSVLAAPIAKPLAPGVYTVHWHAVSTDTHRTQGDFQFTVRP